MFTYPKAYKGSGGNYSALEFGPQCIQGPLGDADCLFLNVWSPHLPQTPESKQSLRPVMFYIHGGGFRTGFGSDPSFDGGNLASRGDVVVVTINYRLGTLGFLALNDGVTNGNFGFADQILALDWVRENIEKFGGNPDQITVMGESAGATAVRALMISPRAAGKFVGAIPLSFLDGIGIAAAFSKYYTIPEAAGSYSKDALAATNCTNATSQVDCLRRLPERDVWWAATGLAPLVIDGVYITSESPPFPKSPIPVTVMMGSMADDGVPFIVYPPGVTAQNMSWLAAQGFPEPPPDLFPIGNTGNQTFAIYRMAGRLATDAAFRCSAQATLHAALQSGAFGPEIYYFEFDRSYQIPEWPMLDLCEAPRTASHPNGDPESPQNNQRCHSGELLDIFGNLAFRGLPHRDNGDLIFERYTLDTFSSFARTRNPNPDKEFLRARGYLSTLEILEKTGPWKPAVKGDIYVKILDYPVQGDMMSGFREVEQCEWLGLPTDYLLRPKTK
jgi:carboxylesterase type B